MILLSLVGEQPAPNLMPLWQFPQIAQVMFAATETTWTKAEEMAKAIRSDSVISHVRVLDHLRVEAYDIQKTRLAISQALGRFLANDVPVWLNLTAGTKIMSLAALQAAYGTGITLMYTAMETREFVFLHSDGSESSRTEIDVEISVQQYLQAHGFEVSGNQAFRPEHNVSPPSPKAGDALEKKVKQLAEESKWFDDVQRGVFIRKQSVRGNVENELDIAVTRGGRLAVCSCKDSNELSKEDLYELSSLMRREYAGIYCGKVLAATAEVSNALVERARVWGIELVGRNQLPNIAYYLKIATE